MTILPLHAGNPGPFTGDGNWTYLVPGPEPLLIDAGVGRPEHLDRIAEAAPRGIARVVVTHAHADHAAGVPALRARWPALEATKMAWPEADAPGIPWTHLEEGARLPAGDGELEVLHTPGHAPDHVVLWHAPSRTLFGADLMQLGGTVVIPVSKGGDLSAYLRSLRRVRALNAARVLPAHGPAIEDPEAVIDQYLTHRHHREVQVLTALESGLDSVETIAGRIYAGVSPALVPFARENVLAHLLKLQQDGLVRRVGERWAIVG